MRNKFFINAAALCLVFNFTIITFQIWIGFWSFASLRPDTSRRKEAASDWANGKGCWVIYCLKINNLKRLMLAWLIWRSVCTNVSSSSALKCVTRIRNPTDRQTTKRVNRQNRRFKVTNGNEKNKYVDMQHIYISTLLWSCLISIIRILMSCFTIFSYNYDREQ